MFSPSFANPGKAWQTFLRPSLPFRKRQSSTDSNISTASTGTTSSIDPDDYLELPPEPQPLQYLNGHSSHISCAKCHADLALTSQIISKGFTGRHGRAYLVAGSLSALRSTPAVASGVQVLPNTHMHKPVPRHLVTGLHTVCDVSCAQCGVIIGWKYVGADDEAQRYKVGKYILETKRITVGTCWENDGDRDGANELRDDNPLAVASVKDDWAEIMFDSQDEDECEDLFAGIWSPALARKRRARKSLR